MGILTQRRKAGGEPLRPGKGLSLISARLGVLRDSALKKCALLLLALAGWCGSLNGDEIELPAAVPPPEPPVALGWDAEKQGTFPVSIAVSGQGEVWVGTEGKGVWKYSPSEKTWTQFTTQDGLGDDFVYAVAIDQLNRVWVGHLNHGVSVWNGAKWKNYAVGEATLGSRVFSIVTRPATDDVWIATDCGIAVYNLKNDDWDYYTQAAGLPSNQNQAIAFDKEDEVFVGTQCDGIASAKGPENFATWRTTRSTPAQRSAATGLGLPSDNINAMSWVSRTNGDVVMAVTNFGVVSRINMGRNRRAAVPRGGGLVGEATWYYGRGADWRMNSPEAPPPLPNRPEINLPREDWITALAATPALSAFGFRQQGIEVRPNAGRVAPQFFSTGLVRAIVPVKETGFLVASYDEKQGGLYLIGEVDLTKAEKKDEPPAPFPAAAKGLDAKTLDALAERVGAFKKTLQPGEGYFLGDDWQTQGDWVGRYGRNYALLCGPQTHEFRGDDRSSAVVTMGTHKKGDNLVASYTHETREATRSVLFDPKIGWRRESEFTDESWDLAKYPFSWEGPDLWVKAKVPDGLHRLTLYFHNNDAQTGQNKLRDYDLELRRMSDETPSETQSIPLAKTRVTDFAGGVYKQFVICGPEVFRIRIARNRSYGTKLQGVFIDALDPEARKKAEKENEVASYNYATPALEKIDAGAESPLGRAVDLWQKLDTGYALFGTSGLQLPFRMLAYRAAVAEKAPAGLLANWRWQLSIWTEEDRAEFTKKVGAGPKLKLKVDDENVAPE